MIERYSRPVMRNIWSDESKYALWLEVETYALEGMQKIGIVTQATVDAVREKGNFSVARIEEIEKEVKHDVIAFLTNVTEHVGEEARWLHFGMTSSDLLDTVFAVQLCRATDLLLEGIDKLLVVVRDLAFQHKNTVCVGRSHGIHAEPTTFGLKCAVWYAELCRQKKRLISARGDIAVGAISGPVGTFAHLSPQVEEYVCAKLSLSPAPVSTQVIQRDRHAALFLVFAQIGATLEKMVIEIRHLQRTEVREAEEWFSSGQKGSSAMPHKRNPILSENVTGLARLLRAWAQSSLENIALWHERDISHSSVERVIAPDITITLDFMLARVSSIIGNLRVYPENMIRNLEMTNGLVFSGTLLVALAAKGISREKAYSLVQKHALATWEDMNANGLSGKSFQDRIRQDEEVNTLLSSKEIDEAFSLNRHTRHVDFIFNRVFSSINTGSKN